MAKQAPCSIHEQGACPEQPCGGDWHGPNRALVTPTPERPSPSQVRMRAADRARMCVNALATVPDPAAYVAAAEAMEKALTQASQLFGNLPGAADALAAFRKARGES